MPHKRPEFLDFEESITLDAANLPTTPPTAIWWQTPGSPPSSSPDGA
jgi:hypothetical protein